VGGSAQFDIIVGVDQSTSGTISNNATVSTTANDPDTANNQSNEETTIMPYGDVDLDGCVGRKDLWTAFNEVGNGNIDPAWDFNNDGRINRLDRVALEQLYTHSNGVCP